MGDEKRAMNDGMCFQLALELDGVSDCDREVCPNLQPLFCQVQDMAEDGVPLVFQKRAAVNGKTELAAVISHDGGSPQ